MLATTQEIISELKEGRMIVLVDEEDRENEGDLVLASDFVTPEAINFMITQARGLVCLTLTTERCRQLSLSLMTQNNMTPYGTAFTVSIEAATGITTGISASDRARTVKAAVAPDAKPTDIVQPGHVFPVVAKEGGILARAGHTEAGCELAKIAGLTASSVICEIIKDDGEMARLPELLKFSERHGLKIGTIVDLIDYHLCNNSVIERLYERLTHTPYGTFHTTLFRDQPTGMPHLTLVKGELHPDKEVWIYMYESPSFLDLLEVGIDDNSYQIDMALRKISNIQNGVLVLLNCVQSKFHFVEKFLKFNESEKTTPLQKEKVDFRNYLIGLQMLRYLGVNKICLLSSSYKKLGNISPLKECRIDINSFFSKPGVQKFDVFR